MTIILKDGSGDGPQFAARSKEGCGFGDGSYYGYVSGDGDGRGTDHGDGIGDGQGYGYGYGYGVIYSMVTSRGYPMFLILK